MPKETGRVNVLRRTFYRCPYCSREYPTRRAANLCASAGPVKEPALFTKGTIITGPGLSRIQIIEVKIRFRANRHGRGHHVSYVVRMNRYNSDMSLGPSRVFEISQRNLLQRRRLNQEAE